MPLRALRCKAVHMQHSWKQGECKNKCTSVCMLIVNKGTGIYVGFVSDVERAVWCVVCGIGVVAQQGVNVSEKSLRTFSNSRKYVSESFR